MNVVSLNNHLKNETPTAALVVRSRVILSITAGIAEGDFKKLEQAVDTVNNEMKEWCKLIEHRRLTEKESDYLKHLSYIHQDLVELQATSLYLYAESVKSSRQMFADYITNIADEEVRKHEKQEFDEAAFKKEFEAGFKKKPQLVIVIHNEDDLMEFMGF